MLHTPEELERTIKEIAKTVLYVLAFVAIVTILVLAVAVKDAQSGELEDGLAEAMHRDFMHATSECTYTFETLDREAAKRYYVCMAAMYLTKADATEKRLAEEEADKLRIEM